MTMDDYLAARMISTPLCLFDCDAPCDGSTAVVVSHRDVADDLDHPPCHVNAVGTALRGRPSWDQFDDMTTMAARDAAASMWERTDCTPADVDMAQLYDGFSHPHHGLARGPRLLRPGRERALRRGRRRPSPATGCSRSTPPAASSRAGACTASASSTRRACSCAGEGGERQVVRPGGRLPEVAAVANGGGPIAGTMLLTRGVR